VKRLDHLTSSQRPPRPLRAVLVVAACLTPRAALAGEPARALGHTTTPRTNLLDTDSLIEPPIGEGVLRASLTGADVVTFTGVPPGAGIRLGVDRDRDGFLDRTEIAAGTDPADPHSNPWRW
jgi:hypothetical protein